MGVPVVVYGFKTDIIFISDNGFHICVDGDPGSPMYASIIIHHTNMESVLEQMEKCNRENDKRICEINEWATECNKLYDKNYVCKWQLALYGDLEYHNFEYESNILSEEMG